MKQSERPYVIGRSGAKAVEAKQGWSGREWRGAGRRWGGRGVGALLGAGVGRANKLRELRLDGNKADEGLKAAAQKLLCGGAH